MKIGIIGAGHLGGTLLAASPHLVIPFLWPTPVA
jgi:hypothetical protein